MPDVIVADDKKFIRHGIAAMLGEIHIPSENIHLCKNGKEALKILESQKIDILITDIRMPEMDGNELMRRAQGICPDLQVIVISAYDDFYYAQESIRYGAKAYLLKPVDKAELLCLVNRIAEDTRHREQTAKRWSTYESLVENLYRQEVSGRDAEIKKSVLEIEKLLYVMGTENEEQIRYYIQQAASLLAGSFAEVVILVLHKNIVSLSEIYFSGDSGRWNELQSLTACMEKGDYQSYCQLLYPYLLALNQSMLAAKRRHCDKADIRYAMEFIAANYDKDINLDMAANAASLNYSYFSHTFKKYAGESFSAHLNRLRIEKAKELLADSKEKVYEVSRAVGFQSDKHFVRTFKKLVGVTPQEYRRSALLKKRKE